MNVWHKCFALSRILFSFMMFYQSPTNKFVWCAGFMMSSTLRHKTDRRCKIKKIKTTCHTKSKLSQTTVIVYVKLLQSISWNKKKDIKEEINMNLNPFVSIFLNYAFKRVRAAKCMSMVFILLIRRHHAFLLWLIKHI